MVALEWNGGRDKGPIRWRGGQDNAEKPTPQRKEEQTIEEKPKNAVAQSPIAENVAKKIAEIQGKFNTMNELVAENLKRDGEELKRLTEEK